MSRGIALPGSETVATGLAEAIELHERVKFVGADAELAAADAIAAALARDGKLFVLGHAGSAADAQHVAALTTDSSVLASVANDIAFDQICARQIEALGRPGEVAPAISTSGESANVVTALHVARASGLKTIGLTEYDGRTVGRSVDVHVKVPSEATARVQDVERTLLL